MKNFWWDLVYGADYQTWAVGAIAAGFVIGLFQSWTTAVLYALAASFALIPVFALFMILGCITAIPHFLTDMSDTWNELKKPR